MELIPAWVAAAGGAEFPVGVAVADALTRALDLRRQVRTGERLSFDFRNPDEVADVLHAVCRSLLEDCVASPATALEDAVSIRKLLESCPWPDDELGERDGLLSSLAFACWRCSRLLDLSREAQYWECEYKRHFRGSLEWEVVGDTWGLSERPEGPGEVLMQSPEAVLQALFYLQEQAEATPQMVASSAVGIHRRLQVGEPEYPSDLRLFFLGDSARLAGGALKGVGRPEDASRWLDLAEEHFRAGVNPQPYLARVMFLRLTLFYAVSRHDLVARAAPRLERTFADFGMQEDRVKCRILWSASMKLAGQCREALEILEPLLQARSEIRPELYGWILLHLGDLHQIFGDYHRALAELTEAARLLREGRQFTGLADVNSMISVIYRAHGRLHEAAELLRRSQEEHARLGIRWLEAYSRVLVAETYLAMGRPRDAELEVRIALPVLEEQNMVVEAVAGLNILREAIRRQKLEPQTLSEVRERFRPKQ